MGHPVYGIGWAKGSSEKEEEVKWRGMDTELDQAMSPWAIYVTSVNANSLPLGPVFLILSYI